VSETSGSTGELTRRRRAPGPLREVEITPAENYLGWLDVSFRAGVTIRFPAVSGALER
jgi:hypothetical protein